MGEPGLAAANLAHSWPLLVTILTQYSGNDRVTEKTGRAIKQALQTSRTASAGMLQQVLETVTRQFHLTGHPCMLYIASELLKTFGGDAQYQAALGGSHTYWLKCECGVLHKGGPIHAVHCQRAAEDVWWGRSVSGSPRWVPQECFCTENYFGKSCQSFFFEKTSVLFSENRSLCLKDQAALGGYHTYWLRIVHLGFCLTEAPLLDPYLSPCIDSSMAAENKSVDVAVEKQGL